MHFDFLSGLYSIVGWTGLAYAAQTFPMPSNKYGKWILGIVQYMLANKQLADQNFASAKKDQQWDDKLQEIKDKNP